MSPAELKTNRNTHTYALKHEVSVQMGHKYQDEHVHLIRGIWRCN